ncbi:MAG: DUF488 domain-containing protein [Clostridia bacterium]|nr:DUF488 domain-containing protein [Clostridia bacterium]MDD4386842.1 DUF488 domain-containing protein [Clostridia bacterium]
MDIYTIGFTKKTAEQFFKLLKKNGIKKVVDIRLSNKSQLAGFAKGADLKYFLELHGIEYEHNIMLAPTEELRKKYNDKKSKMSFAEYTTQFIAILEQRRCIAKLQNEDLHKVCYLCSEDKPDKCHRKLVVNSIKGSNGDIQIIHL